MPPRKRARATTAVTVSTIAGSRAREAGHADGAAADTRFTSPVGLAIDAEGNVLMADWGNHCIRKLAVADGTVSTIAGSRAREAEHADGAAADARFKSPMGIAIDAEGNALVTDWGNHCIRKLAVADGTVSTIAGSREEEPGDADGAAADTRFNYPAGLAIDAEGDVVVADRGNDCIRKLHGCGLERGAAVPRWHVGAPSLGANLGLLLEEGLFADVTFEVAGEQITAHRSILAARSTYFRAMFQSDCHEAQRDAVVRISDCPSEAFHRLLVWLYTDELQLDDGHVVDVLRKAREYGLDRAYNLCMQHCVRSVRPANAVAWLIRADAGMLDELRTVVLSYVKRHFRALRCEAKESLAELRAYPDLMLEVMNSIF